MAERLSQESGRHLILYDGVCGLCNRLNAFVLPRDREGLFHFSPLQSETSRRILLPFGRDPDPLNTLYLITDYRSGSARLWSGARAILFIVGKLGGIWRFASLLAVLPDFLLNAVYGFVARHRYRFFGRYDSCLMPTAEYRKRFIGL